LRPLSFQVPRKSDLFQDDLFPPCRGDESNLSLDAWLAGENATPKLFDLEHGFTPSDKKEKTITKAEDHGDSSHSVADLQRRVAELEAELRHKDDRIQELLAQVGGQ